MITSTSNRKIKEWAKLQRQAKARNEKGVYFAEGLRMFAEIPKEDLLEAVVSESFLKKHGEMLRDLPGHIPVETVSDPVFSHVADTKTPQGILCMVRQKAYRMEDLLEQEAPLLLALDHLQDPGNLGTLLRTGEAAGVTGIVMSRDCVDIYNQKVIRSTMGAICRVPFVYAENLPEALAGMKECGIRVYAAHLEGKNVYDRESYLGGTAFLIGNEGNGLRKETAACADTLIRIPMHGKVESLNAAAAAAVLLFEADRQRRAEDA